jgi:hypothetical protein
MLLFDREEEKPLVICTGKLVTFWFVWNGKEEEEKGVVLLVALL